MDNIRRQILTGAITHYGPATQVIKAMEEAGELVQAIAKHFNTVTDDASNNAEKGATIDHLTEEMADVRIMLDQLEIIFDNHEAVHMWELRKLRRLDQRVHAADEVT